MEWRFATSVNRSRKLKKLLAALLGLISLRGKSFAALWSLVFRKEELFAVPSDGSFSAARSFPAAAYRPKTTRSLS